jgi:hypothetical protein
MRTPRVTSAGLFSERQATQKLIDALRDPFIDNVPGTFHEEREDMIQCELEVFDMNIALNGIFTGQRTLRLQISRRFLPRFVIYTLYTRLLGTYDPAG